MLHIINGVSHIAMLAADKEGTEGAPSDTPTPQAPKAPSNTPRARAARVAKFAELDTKSKNLLDVICKDARAHADESLEHTRQAGFAQQRLAWDIVRMMAVDPNVNTWIKGNSAKSKDAFSIPQMHERIYGKPVVRKDEGSNVKKEREDLIRAQRGVISAAVNIARLTQSTRGKGSTFNSQKGQWTVPQGLLLKKGQSFQVKQPKMLTLNGGTLAINTTSKDEDGNNVAKPGIIKLSGAQLTQHATGRTARRAEATVPELTAAQLDHLATIFAADELPKDWKAEGKMHAAFALVLSAAAHHNVLRKAMSQAIAEFNVENAARDEATARKRHA